MGVADLTKTRQKLACILEANESTRMRMGNSEPHNHEDHIARKGENSLQHYNLVHKFIPMPQAMKIPPAKAAVDKEWEQLVKDSGVGKKLETRIALAMPCTASKKGKHGATRGKSKKIKSKLACIWEASESTRLCMEESLPNHHEDHIAGQGDNSLQHYNLVHK